MYLVGRKFHFQTFLLLKLTEMTSTKVSVYMKTSLQIPWLTSLPSTLTAKKSMKLKFSADKIYYNFLSGEFKGYKYVKFPQTLGAL